MAITLNINGRDYAIDADPQMPLLWAIRDKAGLTGTKFGCGIAQCGACTVIVDGNAVRSCNVPAATAVGKAVRTIEGVSEQNDHPVQLAWQEAWLTKRLATGRFRASQACHSAAQAAWSGYSGARRSKARRAASGAAKGG